MSYNKESVVEMLKNLPAMDLINLTKALEEEWGISAAAMSAPAAAAPAAAASAEEEKTAFTVILKSFGSEKIKIIKTVREITGLGLKEAKDLVEGTDSPVKENVAKAEAEEIKKKLEAEGAVVEIK